VTIDVKALKESVADTVLATILNFPLNVILLGIANELALSVIGTAVFITIVLFNIAVTRKYLVRVYFKTKKKT
jgi:hypothetical protein